MLQGLSSNVSWYLYLLIRLANKCKEEEEDYANLEHAKVEKIDEKYQGIISA